MLKTMEKLTSRLLDAFSSTFQREATIVAAAPGRVNLIGEHIDYNDGFVLPMAIDRYVAIAATPSSDDSVSHATVHSVDMDETIQLPLGASSTPSQQGWGKYLEGVVAGFANRGVKVPAFDAVVTSNVPQGGGLSSSAALEVATATLLESLTGENLSKLDKALLCQKAEHVFAGVPCGIMDQFSSVFGETDHFMLIDCRSQACEMVPFDASGISLLITNSNVKHELTGGEYAERRSDCDNALPKTGKSTWRDVTMNDVANASPAMTKTETMRARHVVSEIQRTTDAAASFRQGEFESVGQLMYQSHDSLRHDFQVSCEELDVLVDIARGISVEGGMIGSRMTGGGFGGCTVSLVKSDQANAIIQQLSQQYQSSTGLECWCFLSRPANGAHLIRGEA
jgi:galactokinase